MTKTQQAIFKALLTYLGSFRAIPGMRELAAELGYASHSTIQCHLNRLVAAGYLKRENNGGLTIPVNEQTAPYLRAMTEDSQRLVDEFC